MRFFIEISYHGKNYHGWQIQENASTIQDEIDNAISLLLKKKIKTMGSGRTDTGVHAINQVAHFDYDQPIDNSFIYRIKTIRIISNRFFIIKIRFSKIIVSLIIIF